MSSDADDRSRLRCSAVIHALSNIRAPARLASTITRTVAAIPQAALQSLGALAPMASVVFKEEEVPELLRQLRRIPHGQGRARLLALVLDRFPAMAGEPAAAASASPVIVTREASPDEERYLSIIEDSANQRTALHMRYLTS